MGSMEPDSNSTHTMEEDIEHAEVEGCRGRQIDKDACTTVVRGIIISLDT
jgi:hypothetical protein